MGSPLTPDRGPLGSSDLPPEPTHLRALLDDASDLAAILGADGKLRYLNRAGRRMLGVPPDASAWTLDALGLLTPNDAERLLVEVQPGLEADGTWAGTLALLTPHGSEIITRSTLRRITTDDGGQMLTWVARDISTDRAVVEHIVAKTFYDALTGLPHKSLFLDKLDLALRKLRDDATPVAVVFVSIDRFKEKNDRFGNEVGDQLLKAVASRLGTTIAEGDTVARWGGDEFVVLREGIADEHDAIDLASQILTSFEQPFLVGGEIYLTASIGIATAAPGELTMDDVLRRADAAGQMAKQRGGGALHLFDEDMRARALRRAEVEDALRGAADRGELVLLYQPEVLLRTNEIVAVEALLRWHHPQWGLVPPSEFVPIAEGGSLILEIGEWVLREAMRQAALWREQFVDRHVTVAINLSAKQFVQDDFVETVARILESSGADPADICLEITETILMDDLDVTVSTLRRLKALGVKLAVDDFGTGYSSLSYLRRFPVDVLKVDQSFVSGLGHDPEDSAIVQAVVHMGQALGHVTVAEGVETGHHLIELRELGCDIAQGYHFARPVSADTVTRLLGAGRDWMSLAG